MVYLCVSKYFNKRKMRMPHYLFLTDKIFKFVVLRANASTIPVNYVQIIPPQAEWCLNIVWVPGIGRQRRALRTRGTNIKTIFIKTPAVKGLRGENAYTKVCNFLRALFPLYLNCGSLRLALACCGSLRVAVARCSSSHSDQYNPFNNIFVFFCDIFVFLKEPQYT